MRLTTTRELHACICLYISATGLRSGTTNLSIPSPPSSTLLLSRWSSWLHVSLSESSLRLEDSMLSKGFAAPQQACVQTGATWPGGAMFWSSGWENTT